MRIAIVTAVIVTAALGAPACKKKITARECDDMVARFGGDAVGAAVDREGEIHRFAIASHAAPSDHRSIEVNIGYDL